LNNNIQNSRRTELAKSELAKNLEIIFDATVLFSDAKTNPIVMLTDIFSLTE